jgi:hypothetical protein
MNFWQLFRKCATAQKPVYMPMELILNKKGMCLPRVSSIFKKISPKMFGPHCVALRYSYIVILLTSCSVTPNYASHIQFIV